MYEADKNTVVPAQTLFSDDAVNDTVIMAFRYQKESYRFESVHRGRTFNVVMSLSDHDKV